MKSEELKSVTLDTIARGAAKEIFSEELERVIDNILDPSRDAESKRSITMKFTFAPKENGGVLATVSANTKLAPIVDAGVMLQVGRRFGENLMIEQMDLFDQEEEEAKPVPIRDGGA